MIHNMAKSEGPTNYYIGAERVGSSKAWTYADGETFVEKFSGTSVWAKNEPNNKKEKENCILVRGTGTYEARWNDADCTMNARVVCKRVKQANPFKGDNWFDYKESASKPTCYYKYFNRVLNKKIAPYKRKSWFDAEKQCSKLQGGGGHLASITSQGEQSFIQNLIYKEYEDFENRPVWLGGRRAEDKWDKWSDGKKMTYTNWMQDQPSKDVWTRNGDAPERCIQMSHSHVQGGDSSRKNVGSEDFNGVKVFTKTIGKKGQWNDADCEKHRGYVCEICTDRYDNSGPE